MDQEKLQKRVRLLKDIDLTKADPECMICKGTGVLRYETIKEQKKGFRPKQNVIPHICFCVTKNGGIARDPIDDILEKAQKAKEITKDEDGTIRQVDGRAGFRTDIQSWVCSICRVIEYQPAKGVHGEPLLPDGWQRLRDGTKRIVCTKCGQIQEAE